MPDQPALTVLGTGIMGGAMAARWAGAGPVTVWNRDRAKAERVAAAGARVAATPAEAVEGAEVVVTMLADGDVTASVMGDALASVPAGATWLQMATVGLAPLARLEAMAAGAGVAFVDAPVLGTKAPAENGQLTVFAAGDDAVLDRVGPVFGPVAATVLRVGGVGDGTRLKLVVNGWLAALVAGLAESVALAEGLGVDPRRFLEVIDGGPLGPAYAQLKGAMMVGRDYPASFPLHLLTKDVELVAAAAEDAGLSLRLPAAIRDLLVAAEVDHAEDDMAAVVEAIRPR
jgi:3-hydroxyisobutyrate dehydrogenase